VDLYELYDLEVTASGGLADVTVNSVQINEQFLDTYYFVHVTDSHMPTTLYYYESGAATDSTELEDMRAVIEDINIINPEFVLFTGDLVNEGELEDYLGRRYYSRSQRVLEELAVPVYLTSGNHDIGGWDSTPPPRDGTARRDWWRFFGWPRLDSPPPGAPEYTQNYSFDYGPVHYVGLEAYENYDDWRYYWYGTESFTPGQLNWLNADLAAAGGSLAQVLFYHRDFADELDLSGLGVELALSGHLHYDSGAIHAPPYDLTTDNVCDGDRAYRLIRVYSGAISPRLTLQAGSYGEYVQVDYSPDNDGSHDAVTAEVTNYHGERFQNGRLRFLLSNQPGTLQVTGGELLQTDRTGEFLVCYVKVDIGASSSQTVAVALDTLSSAAENTPAVLTLGPNRPNPFNPTTELFYSVPHAGPVQLVIYDQRGREVTVLVDEFQTGGDHHVKWHGRDNLGQEMPSGVYLARITAGREVQTRKLVLAR